MESPSDSQLLEELMQTLVDDVARLTRLVESQAKPVTAGEIQPALQQLASGLVSLSGRLPTSPVAPPAMAPPVDLTGIERALQALRQEVRQKPEYRVSQYVRSGGVALVVALVGLMGMSWLALDWKQQLNRYQPAYEAASWRLRYIRQADPGFHAHVKGLFAKDTPGIEQWTQAQEQADQQRELARQAAEQAKAMNAQADQLEGKSSQKH